MADDQQIPEQVPTPVDPPMEPGVPPPPPVEIEQPLEPPRPPDQPPEAAPPKPQIDWRDRRIAQLTAQLHAARAQTRTEPPAGPPDRAEIDRQVEERAAALAAANDFARRCNEVAEAGRTVFPDFDARVGQLKNMVGDSQERAVAYNHFLSAALETGEAAKIIHAMGGDLNEAARVLEMSPIKMAVEVARMGARPTNQTSSVPKPINPVGSHQANRNPIAPDDVERADTLPTDEWMKRRAAQTQERGIR